MKYYNTNYNNIILRDYLAIDRTKLANERTFLAFCRTSVGFFGAGAGSIKFLNEPVFSFIGWSLIFLSPFILVWGIWRYFVVKKRMDSIPDD